MSSEKMEDGSKNYDNEGVTFLRVLQKLKEWQESLAIMIGSLDNPNRLFEIIDEMLEQEPLKKEKRNKIYFKLNFLVTDL